MTIISGSYDKTLHLWDAKTGAAIGKAMEGHTNPVKYITFSDDGKHIISESYNEVFTWNLTTKSQLSAGEVPDGIGISNSIFTLEEEGWVVGSESKRMFWLPTDLRGELISQGSILAVANQRIPVFNISACGS
ncbi:hypothetical protein FRB94_007975 [Tulasnella sp. JGI-2019a]|nr:hypothetical protein FRB94_007975 [Tulasnella sp. JGI-2019a]